MLKLITTLVFLILHAECTGLGCTPADIVVMMDSSDSIGWFTFENTIKPFVEYFIQNNDGRGQQVSTKIGLIEFSGQSHIDVEMQSSPDKLEDELRNYFNYRGGKTDINLAINYTHSTMFTSYKGDRQTVQNILVILSDFAIECLQDALKEAEKLKTDGTIIYVVPIEAEDGYIDSNAARSFASSGTPIITGLTLKNTRDKAKELWSAICNGPTKTVAPSISKTISTSRRTTTRKTTTTAISATTVTPTSQLATFAPAPCVDVDTTCSIYGKEICKNFRTWAAKNCQKFCDICQVQTSIPITHQQTSPSPPSASTAKSTHHKILPSTVNVNCIADSPDCTTYGRTICTQYPDWAKGSCPNLCGFCGATTQKTRNPQISTTVSTVKCVADKPECKMYTDSVCTTFRDWAIGSCPNLCGLCNRTNIVSSTNVQMPFRASTTIRITPKTQPISTTTRPITKTSTTHLPTTNLQPSRTKGTTTAKTTNKQTTAYTSISTSKQTAKPITISSVITRLLTTSTHLPMTSRRVTTTATTGPQCVDINSLCGVFGSSICHEHKTWAETNCPKLCSVCSITTAKKQHSTIQTTKASTATRQTTTIASATTPAPSKQTTTTTPVPITHKTTKAQATTTTQVPTTQTTTKSTCLMPTTTTKPTTTKPTTKTPAPTTTTTQTTTTTLVPTTQTTTTQMPTTHKTTTTTKRTTTTTIKQTTTRKTTTSTQSTTPTTKTTAKPTTAVPKRTTAPEYWIVAPDFG